MALKLLFFANIFHLSFCFAFHFHNNFIILIYTIFDYLSIVKVLRCMMSFSQQLFMLDQDEFAALYCDFYNDFK